MKRKKTKKKTAKPLFPPTWGNVKVTKEDKMDRMIDILKHIERLLLLCKSNAEYDIDKVNEGEREES